jgi:hypothetical protein
VNQKIPKGCKNYRKGKEPQIKTPKGWNKAADKMEDLLTICPEPVEGCFSGKAAPSGER